MVATIIVIAIIVIALIIGIRSYREKLAHGCCGAGGGTVETKAEDKQLEGTIIAEKTIRIEGMSCINCQNRIQKRLNKIEGLSAQVDWKKGTAIVRMDREIPDSTIRMAILQLEYKVISID